MNDNKELIERLKAEAALSHTTVFCAGKPNYNLVRVREEDFHAAITALQSTPPAPASLARTPQFRELVGNIDRAVELAGRLVSAGPKCCNVSCSETHEVADFIHDAANMLVAMDEPLSAALTPGDAGGEAVQRQFVDQAKWDEFTNDLICAVRNSHGYGNELRDTLRSSITYFAVNSMFATPPAALPQPITCKEPAESKVAIALPPARPATDGKDGAKEDHE